MKHVTVHRNPAAYSSFPYAVTVGDGRIMVAYREATGITLEAIKNGGLTHQDPDSRVVVKVSEDGGDSWPDSGRVVAYQGKYAVNDPSLLVLPSGELLMRLAMWELVPSSDRHSLDAPLTAHWPQFGLVGASRGTAFIRSSDNGASWSDLSWLDVPILEKAMSRDAPVILKDGTLLLSVYEGHPEHVERAWVVRSWDRGLTWRDPVLMAGDPSGTPPYRAGTSYNEVAMTQRPDGTIVAIARADNAFHTEDGQFMPVGGVGELMYLDSLDSGMTWSVPRPAGIWGQPAHLLPLESGRLLCTFGHRRRPYGVRAALSDDGGRSWSAGKVALREDAAGWDVGYPCSVQREDGTIVSLYYIYLDDNVRFVAATLWREEEALGR